MSRDRQVQSAGIGHALPLARRLQRLDGILCERHRPPVGFSRAGAVHALAPNAMPSKTKEMPRDQGGLTERLAVRKIEAPQGLKVFTGLPERNFWLPKTDLNRQPSD